METNLEEKLGALLSDPEMMAKIQNIAQSLGQSPPDNASHQEIKPPNVDLSMVQALSGLTGKMDIDQNQQSLLSALMPYMHPTKVRKLENAMRAAKMARLASNFLGNGGLQKLTGR